LGIPDDTLVVAAFGTAHPSRMTGYIAAAANAIARQGRSVLLLNLGTGAPSLDLDPAVQKIEPGPASAESVAAHLAASDLFLAAWVDGASTRRGTLMAALQHRLPVVTTVGPLTDSVLQEAGEALELVPGGRVELFAEAACRLAADPERRSRLGKAGRALYEQEFDWPVIVRRVISLLEPAQPSARD
jgi:glycosyltransferase involved in cell wall biosynthesis